MMNLEKRKANFTNVWFPTFAAGEKIGRKKRKITILSAQMRARRVTLFNEHYNVIVAEFGSQLIDFAPGQSWALSRATITHLI